MTTSPSAGGPVWSSRYPKWGHILLARGYGILLFVVLALIGNILVVPLGSGLDHWAEGVQSQVQALPTGARQHPLAAGLIALGVVLLGIAGRYADNVLIRHDERMTSV